MSQTNMVNQNGVPQQFKPQFNGVDSTHSSADSSPSTKMYKIPATQLPPSRIIPSNQLPPSNQQPPSNVSTIKPQNMMVNQLTQNYSNLNLASNTTPLSSPKKQIFSTSTPLQDVEGVEAKANVVTNKSGALNVNFNHSNVLSPISTQQSAGFTHSVNSQFSNVPLMRPTQNVPVSTVKESNISLFSQNNQAQAAASQISSAYQNPVDATQKIVPSTQYRPNLTQFQPQRNGNSLPQQTTLQPRLMAYTNPPLNAPLVNKVPLTSQNQSVPLTGSAHMQQVAPSHTYATGQPTQNVPPMSQPQPTQMPPNMPGMGQNAIPPTAQQTSSMRPQYIPPQSTASYMGQTSMRQTAPQMNLNPTNTNMQPRPQAPYQNMPPMSQTTPNIHPNAPPPIGQQGFNQMPPQMVTNPNQPNRPPNLLSHQQSTPNLYHNKQMPPKTNSLPGPQEMPPTMHLPPKTSVHTNRYPAMQPPPQFNNPAAYNPVQQQQYQQQAQPNYYQNPALEQQQPATARQSVTQSGFNKMWGAESYDLMQTPQVLPETKVDTPTISLGNQLMDAANCSPDIFRCTMTKIPETSTLLQKSRLPLGVLIHPFRDLNHLPVIQCNAIVRCRACRTYINPFVFFVDSKRWKCNLCYRVNELPEEFQYDPVSKSYGDPSRRPEVKASTIEYIAPAEYMLRPPQPAVYLYLLDISRNAVESGYLQSVCSILTAELPNLPGDARTHIGFIAYDSALHFFSMADGLSQPHEMTVLDIDDIFLPCPDNLLCNLQDRMELVADLLTQLPNMYNNTYDTGSALGAALQAAHKMMAGTGGRVTVFQASLPTLGPGALISREDPSQRSASDTPHLNPANDFYKRLALECSGQQIAVDIFLVNSQYVDLATLSGISRFSGGCIYHFPLFKASRVLQNESFERTFKRYLTRKIGFEAVMRIRCTRGLAIHTFHGNFFVRSTDLLSLPNINPDAGFGMQVAIEESLSDVQTVCFQAALLYTSSKGERRIRVHTMCLPVVSTLSDIIQSADQQCIIGLLSKMGVDRSMQTCLADAREAFINVAIDILSSYKLLQNMGSASSGLAAPRCLLLLPLYISALLKNTAFRVGVSTRLDDRVKAMCDMKSKPLPYLIQNIYPDLYPVHRLESQPTVTNEEEEHVPMPPRLQLTARNIDSDGAYIFDLGEHMLLLICSDVNPVFLNHALGVADYQSIGDSMFELPVLENDYNQRLHMFINYLNDEKPMNATIQIIRENSHLRTLYIEKLIEDRVENALSYHEFLQHLKTQVK